MTLNSQKTVLVFFGNFRLWCTFHKWIAPIWLEIDLDNLQTATAKAVVPLISFAQITCISWQTVATGYMRHHLDIPTLKLIIWLCSAGMNLQFRLNLYMGIVAIGIFLQARYLFCQQPAIPVWWHEYMNKSSLLFSDRICGTFSR